MQHHFIMVPAGGDHEVWILLAVKKDVVDKVSKVEKEFLHRYDEEKGSKYYQYK